MDTFAGFWRDGALIQPEKRHLDYYGFFIVKHKHLREHNGMSIWQPGDGHIEDVYWLDTTTPTELTPQEAFELYGVMYPQIKSIEKSSDGWSVNCGMQSVKINWGDTTKYPSQQKWRVPTDADKGKRCRYWDEAEDVYSDGIFIATHDGAYLVLHDDDYYSWSNCEVLE